MTMVFSGWCTSQKGCSLAQCREQVFLAGGFDLLGSQHISGCATHGIDADNILAPETGDGIGNVSLASRTHADLLRHVGREPRGRRAGHVMECSANFLIGEELEERRLSQAGGEGLL